MSACDAREAVLDLLMDLGGAEAVEAAGDLDEIGICEAIWLWGADYHTGQGSEPYRALCRVEALGFRMAPDLRAIDLDVERRAVYEALGGVIDFELSIIDPPTGAVEWEGSSRALVAANANLEGDVGAVRDALAELLSVPVGETVLCGLSWFRRA